MSMIANLLGTMAYYAQTRGENDKAKMLYQQALDKGLDNPKYIGAYGVMALRAGKFEIAIDLFTKALRRHPKPRERYNIRMSRAIAYMKLGDYEHARAALEDLHEKFQSDRVYQTLGYLYIVTGDDEKALAYNEEALNYNEHDPVILDNIAQLYLNKGHIDVAKGFLEEAYAVNQEKVDVNYHLACVAETEKDYDAAYRYASQAKECRIDALNDVTLEEIDQMIQRLSAHVSIPATEESTDDVII